MLGELTFSCIYRWGISLKRNVSEENVVVFLTGSPFKTGYMDSP